MLSSSLNIISSIFKFAILLGLLGNCFNKSFVSKPQSTSISLSNLLKPSGFIKVNSFIVIVNSQKVSCFCGLVSVACVTKTLFFLSFLLNTPLINIVLPSLILFNASAFSFHIVNGISEFNTPSNT
jgi:hypothetical protein